MSVFRIRTSSFYFSSDWMSEQLREISPEIPLLRMLTNRLGAENVSRATQVGELLVNSGDGNPGLVTENRVFRHFSHFNRSPFSGADRGDSGPFGGFPRAFAFAKSGADESAGALQAAK
jgi:hypothetical protein